MSFLYSVMLFKIVMSLGKLLNFSVSHFLLDKIVRLK